MTQMWPQEHTTRGKWSQEGVPHRGWRCVEVSDLGKPAAVCGMCETAEIRYVHTMRHVDYPDDLEVGCVCAEHMEEDYITPRQREQRLRTRARRLAPWMARLWLVSRTGHWYLKTEGFLLTLVHQQGGWRVCVATTDTRPLHQWGKRVYPTVPAAKQGALDALLWAKDQWHTRKEHP